MKSKTPGLTDHKKKINLPLSGYIFLISVKKNWWFCKGTDTHFCAANSGIILDIEVTTKSKSNNWKSALISRNLEWKE